MHFRVTPIYGNGWTDSVRSIATPSAFKVRGELLHHCVNGKIETSGPFHGARFEGVPRHAEPDGIYSCQLSVSGGQQLNGYCLIECEK